MNPVGERDDPCTPVVSIGMPVRNCEKTLPIAIRSILNQTFPHWELLVVDDGSSDGTAAGIGDPRIRVVADGFHAGLPARLNQAVRLSRGKYFARMDGDDVSFPERLARQVSYLEAHPEVDLVAASVLVFKGEGEVIGQRTMREPHAWICRRPWASFPMAHPTWMGRSKWFRANPYSPAAVRSEDQELLLRTYKHSRFAGLADVLLGYREERLLLGNLCLGRVHYVKAVVRQAAADREYTHALAGLAGHSMRLLADVMAITSGLDYRILRHRATPAPEEVVAKWNSVWALNQPHVYPQPALQP